MNRFTGGIVGLILFALLFFSQQWTRQHGWTDLDSGRRFCGTAPAPLTDWSSTGAGRKPSDLRNLETWLNGQPDAVNTRYDAFCWTPLHTAARFGREDIGELLIARRADVRTHDDDGKTPLHVAAQYGHAKMATLLLEHGAAIDAKEVGGGTPLREATLGLGPSGPRLEVATLLLDRGADVNAFEPQSGFTPLFYAVAGSSTDAQMAELLVARGADVNAKAAAGDSVLQRAAYGGNRWVVEMLLEYGADVNASGRDSTPLGDAACAGNIEVVELLLNHGADVNRRIDRSRLPWGGLPLALALRCAGGSEKTPRVQIASILVARDALVDARNDAGETLLHRAAADGHLAGIELLVSHGARVDATDLHGFTPLHSAVKEGRLEVAARLLALGASADARGTDGRTPSDLATNDPEMDALVRRYAKH
jgi:ankyrin repeat protein